jgi:hypothetical protein
LKAEENPGAASGGAALVWALYRRRFFTLSTPCHKKTGGFSGPAGGVRLGLIHAQNRDEQGQSDGVISLTNRRSRCNFDHRTLASGTITDGREVSFGETTGS